MQLDEKPGPREPLTKEKVAAASALAHGHGVESTCMRRLAQELGVVPMALYNHVANKDEMLGGMVDVVVGRSTAPRGTHSKLAIRRRVLSARAPSCATPGRPG